MKGECKACGRERWMLDGQQFGVHFCRYCDAASLGNLRYAGPPSLSFTDGNGLFDMLAPEATK